MSQIWIRIKVGWKQMEDRSLEEVERNGKKKENLPQERQCLKINQLFKIENFDWDHERR